MAEIKNKTVEELEEMYKRLLGNVSSWKLYMISKEIDKKIEKKG